MAQTDRTEIKEDQHLNTNSDLEVLALILKSVCKTEKENHRIASRLLERYDDLQGVFSVDEMELLQTGFITPQISKELCRLKYIFSALEPDQLTNRPLLEHMNAVVDYYRNVLMDRNCEQFHAMFLDHHFCLIDDELLGIGSINHGSVLIRSIMSSALYHNARHLVLLHNDPQGLGYPSVQDILMTHDIIRAGAYLGINIADHLILARNDEFSFRKNNLMG